MRRTPFLSTALLALAMPLSLSAQQSNEVWQFFDDPIEEGGPFLMFGVPETDQRALQIACLSTPGTEPYVDIVFSANIGPFGAQEFVDLRWETELGSASFQAITVIGEADEGAVVLTELSSIFMQQLATAPSLTYGLSNPGGLPQVTLPLTAAQDQVSAFTQACAGLGQAPATAEPEFGTALLPIVPDIGPNISGHVWTRFSQVSDNVFETILNVTYGVPETDDVYVLGSCNIGAQGPLVTMQFAADIEGLQDGDVAALQFTSGDMRVTEVEGSVIGQFAEFGVSGVEIVLEMSDPAWLVIAGDPSLRFQRVGGAAGLTITGNGPSTLGPFLADCDQIDNLSVEGGLAPSAPIGAQEGYLACDSFGRVGSRDTGQPTVMTFFNDTGLYRGLLWIDANGVPVDQAGLNPGESTTYTTDPGHVWMATDGPGNCREMIQPVAGQSEYRLLVE